MKTALFALLLVGLAACATSGVKIDMNQVATLKPGVSTYADVVGKFGRPTTETMSSNGMRFVTYSYSTAAARPETFIPFVGGFVGGADAQSQVVMFQFGADGKLTGTNSSTSNIGTGTGLLSGGNQAQRTNQPITPP